MPLRVEMEGYGGPDVLRAVERPRYEPGAGEVVVRVAAAGVNRADLFIRDGTWPQGGAWPYVPGLECVGTIEQIGDRISDGDANFQVGDRVITMMQRLGGIHGTRPGGYQETALLRADTLARVPDGIDLETAAALGLAAVTADQALRLLDVAPGQRALVLGGSSGVGTMAIQMLKARGAHVIATGTRSAKFDVIRDAGADLVIDTRSDGWTARMGGEVHRIVDLVGAATFGAAIDWLAPGGRYVIVGGTSGDRATFSLWTLMRPVTLTGYTSEELTREQLVSSVDAIGALVAAGRLRVAELRRYPLAEAARAHAAMEAGEVAGRVILVAH